MTTSKNCVADQYRQDDQKYHRYSECFPQNTSIVGKKSTTAFRYSQTPFRGRILDKFIGKGKFGNIYTETMITLSKQINGFRDLSSTILAAATIS